MKMFSLNSKLSTTEILNIIFICRHLIQCCWLKTYHDNLFFWCFLCFQDFHNDFLFFNEEGSNNLFSYSFVAQNTYKLMNNNANQKLGNIMARNDDGSDPDTLSFTFITNLILVHYEICSPHGFYSTVIAAMGHRNIGICGNKLSSSNSSIKSVLYSTL